MTICTDVIRTNDGKFDYEVRLDTKGEHQVMRTWSGIPKCGGKVTSYRILPKTARAWKDAVTKAHKKLGLSI